MSKLSDRTETKVSFLSAVPGILMADFNVRLQETGSDCTYYANTYSGKDDTGTELPQPLKAILDAVFSEAGCANHVFVHPFTMQVMHSRAVEREALEGLIKGAISRNAQ